MNSSVWLDLCEVPADVSRLFNIEPYDVVCIYAETNVPELTRTVVRAMPTAPNSTGVVRCHPFLWDFLDQALQVSTNSDSNYPSEGDPTFSLCSLQAETLSHLHRNQQSHGWKLSKLTPVDLAEDDDVTIHLSILYLDCNVVDLSSADIAVTLEDRFVMVESIVALSTPSGNCIGLVTRLVDSGNDLDPHKSYRIGLDVLVHLDTSRVPTTNADHHSVTTDFGEGTVQSPGYEDLVARLVALCQIKGPAAPSGILLTGSAGVGKSRVASCVAQRLLMSDNNNSRRVHMLSAQDLLLRASFASETDLVELIVPSSIQEYALVVIDDLNILDSDDSADSVRDHEWLLTRNSLVVALGRLHHHHQADCCVLGIARHAATLPKELTRIHRLEKVVEMPTPTQSQREDILHSLLPQNSSWAESLAANTAGFVAADLCRVCTDATTVARVRSSNHLQWKDLMEAARHTVPSQLSQLDVTKTVAFADTTGEPGEELKVHEWAWQKFGGYEAIKKRIYQTVVVPWRRALSNQEPLIAGLYPPGGVLFHGPPGVGKTMAAGCLAASLGLHVVKVRASDVLDQWLGGSEAAIRALFARARSAAPCILFFDEIDAIAANREQGTENDVSSRILSTFLNEMDGVSTRVGHDGILVVACTNRPDDLDSALLRPGRLEEHVLLSGPDHSDICDILGLKLGAVPLDDGVDLTQIASVLVGSGATGATIEAICRDACSTAIRSADNTSKVRVSAEMISAAIQANTNGVAQ